MVVGLESFKAQFRGYDGQYVIIGGTACDILMSEQGRAFRATRDIDMVLIVEMLTADFGKRFWEYIRRGGYSHKNKSTGEPQFFRFSNPSEPDYPAMIELFSIKPDVISLPENAVLTPLPLSDELSSLSGILLDNDYCHFLCSGKTVTDGVAVLDAEHLIPLKAKAWLNLTEKRNNGEAVDSRNIRKHKNDVFRLSLLLTPEKTTEAPPKIKTDLSAFMSAVKNEPVDFKQLGIRGDSEEIISRILDTYI